MTTEERDRRLAGVEHRLVDLAARLTAIEKMVYEETDLLENFEREARETERRIHGLLDKLEGIIVARQDVH